MSASWLLLAVVVGSWALTYVLRRYALAKRLIDIPNDRSSHKEPTPRGGGVAIVASFLLALPLLGSIGLMNAETLYGVFGSALIIAAIGFADDHGHIAARWRLLGHFIASAWVLYWTRGLSPILLFNVTFDVGWLGDILALVYLVWMLNLYNFMDGIDGLASIEAISVCVGMCLIYWITGFNGLMWGPLLLTGAVVGFLFWNFPPAGIFMGDAGSGFLGIVLGAFSLNAAWTAPELLWSWLILLGVFIVDATWTLVTRFFNGNKIYEAHRSHAYQKASRSFNSHKTVSLAVLSINLVWLLPIAMWVAIGGSGVLGVIAAYTPLCGLAWKFKAGQPD
ncbi:glycosyltransferase family 4 protein [Pseudomonas koreensis]|uniref:MraY family glycosyltransferase n=1 Tax=Pseudomonas koreensis TaxID=198620 RepID=UPI00123C39B9|nr:glycosyltransferase family 4 protein [Pseudomonas koreensis]KAA8742502.1 glycosyltransferase family 4 protein [Pseudomonas koreensis]